MRHSIRLSTALLCLALCACGNFDIKESLGLNRKGPDAFQVYSRPPLTVPPDFTLQPPGKGPEYSSGTPADIQAHNQMLTTGDATSPAASSGAVQFLNSATTGPADTAVPAVSANALPSGGDAQFLADVGAARADPNIREEIEKDKETGAGPKKDNTYLFSGKSDADPVVDSNAEATRLKQDKNQDKPVTSGDTPVIAPQDKGLLGNIF